jgi:hypothetical protein
MAGGEQQQAHRDDLVGLERDAAIGGMDQRAQQILARIEPSLRDDRNKEQHHRHRRRADRLALRGRRVELEHPRKRRGLGAEKFRALEADVEQLRDHSERDRVGELAHQLDRLAVSERRACAVDDPGDTLTDTPHRARGKEAVHSAPQPRVGRRVAHQQRLAPHVGAGS